jgi:hypothetical protein
MHGNVFLCESRALFSRIIDMFGEKTLSGIAAKWPASGAGERLGRAAEAFGGYAPDTLRILEKLMEKK